MVRTALTLSPAVDTIRFAAVNHFRNGKCSLRYGTIFRIHEIPANLGGVHFP